MATHNPTTSSKQDEEFLKEAIGTDALERAIDFIKSNFTAEELYGEKELLDWASNYDPDSIFKVSELESWAENNGYVKE